MKKCLNAMIALGCLIGCSMPALASAEESAWTVYGEAGVILRYVSLDEDAGDTTLYSQSAWEYGDLGAKYKSDNMEGKVSVGIDDGAFAGSNDATIGAAWVKANLGSFSIEVGRDDPLTFNPIEPWQQKNTASGIGLEIGGTEHYQLRFIVPVAQGLNFEVMAAQPAEKWATEASAATEEGFSTEVTMPAIEARFGGFTGFPWAVFGGYESYEEMATNETISAYCVGFVVRPKIGPFNTNFTASYSTNLYQADGAPPMTTPTFGSFPLGGWNYDPNSTTEKVGAAFSAQTMITEKFGIGFGGGYQMFTADDGANGAYEDPTTAMYVNMKYEITKNFSVYPYVVYENYDTVTLDGVDIDQGSATQVGLMWKAVF